MFGEEGDKIKVWRAWKGRWLVDCPFCVKGPFEFLVPWASSWRVAYAWAVRHAQNHEKTKCPTCGNKPRLPEFDEVTKARSRA